MNINPYSKVIHNVRRSEPLIERYHDRGWHEAKYAILQAIENNALRILVYGAYNAGKSTLINVLLGEEQARVGDIPTTDRVDAYDWSGYRLLDTPGVNAPITHEQATAEQLARTKAVVLVVREGDQDAKDVYSRLFSMLKDEKAIFVILNHQLGSSKEIVHSIKRVTDILADLAPEHGVAHTEVERLTIYPVNLNTALTGRMRGHDKLLEHSGFTRFVDAFADWTRQHDSHHHHLSEVKDTVKSSWYDPAMANLNELAETEDESEVEQLREVERTLVAQRSRMYAASYPLVESEIQGIRANIGKVIGESESKEEADEGLRSLVQPMLKKIKDWLGDELHEVDAGIAVTVEAPETDEGDGGTSAQSGSGMREFMADNRERVVEKFGKFVTDKDKVKSVLLAGRRTKALGIRDVLKLKGKWETTLDKSAARFTHVAKGGLWALQLLLAAWDAKRAHDRQKRENQEMKRLAVASHQAVEEICGELRGNLLRAIDGIIDDTLGSEVVRIRERIEGMTNDWSERKRHYQELLQHRSQLEEIVFNGTQRDTAS